MGNDYQNAMHGEVLKADKIGNAVSGNFNQMTSELPQGLQNWGMLPGINMPLDHVFERQEFFRGEIERTLREGPDQPFMDKESIAGSGALKTQQKMLNNYIMDGQLLPTAEMQFNTFAPIANMAAKSAAKTNEVGAQLGVNATQQISPLMDKKHADALKKAVTGAEKKQGLKRGDSVQHAQQKMLAQRNVFMGATHQLSAYMTKDVVEKLRGEVGKAEAEKKEVYEKIERAQKIGEVIETLGSLAAGGAGAFEAATAHEMAGKIGGAGDALETGGGIVGGLAGGIAKLYYADKLTELEATITRASGEINGWNLAAEATHLIGLKDNLKGQAQHYQEAVKGYEDAVNDRRMAFAAMGEEADAGANKGKPAKKQDQVNSAVMLWIESLMESKSALDAGTQAGHEAKARLDDVSSQVASHRGMGWSNIEDIWGSGSGSGGRREDGGKEMTALGRMRLLTDSWLKGAAELKTRLDGAVGTADPKEKGAAGTMAQAGYSGDF